jgi:hypothetical protein
MSKVPIVTLTTDFGIDDSYVGTMKGVILDIAPQARLVDVTHQIARQDVRQTAYVLYSAYRFFPRGAVHLVVVDPGVGSRRRPIAVQCPCGTFVGPDNGVFSYVMGEESVQEVIELADIRYRLPTVSRTFHGRDIFAPAAAHLAAGVPIESFGPPVKNPVSLPIPLLNVGSRTIRGEVLDSDHFGNVITSIGRLSWEGNELSLQPAFQLKGEEQARFPADELLITVGGMEIEGLLETYADVERGTLLALVGSSSHLEIAIREGNAAERLDVQAGDAVELSW